MFITQRLPKAVKGAFIAQELPDSITKTEGVLIAGGFPTEWFLSNHPETEDIEANFTTKDIDVYCDNPETFRELKNELDKSYSQGIETELSVTYTRQNRLPIQLIKFKYGNAEKVLSSFDFINCSVAVDLLNNRLTRHKDILLFHNQGVLELHDYNTLDPKSESFDQARARRTMLRVVKYCKKYNYELGEILQGSLEKLREAKPKLFGFLQDVVMTISSSSGNPSPDTSTTIQELIELM